MEKGTHHRDDLTSTMQHGPLVEAKGMPHTKRNTMLPKIITDRKNYLANQFPVTDTDSWVFLRI